MTDLPSARNNVTAGQVWAHPDGREFKVAEVQPLFAVGYLDDDPEITRIPIMFLCSEFFLSRGADD